MAEESLTLVRANNSRGGGHWSDDDYDVYASERAIGRIMLQPHAPVVLDDHRYPRAPSIYDRGYAASREQAMADFKTRWCLVNDLPCALQPSAAVTRYQFKRKHWVAGSRFIRQSENYPNFQGPGYLEFSFVTHVRLGQKRT